MHVLVVMLVGIARSILDPVLTVLVIMEESVGILVKDLSVSVRMQTALHWLITVNVM